MTIQISVIMPNLNMGTFLDAALRSIRIQDIQVKEVILIDCGSTDETFDVIRNHHASGLQIRVVHHCPAAPGVVRNAGLATANGNTIAFLDSDDLWPPGKLRRQVGRLVSEPRVDMVSGYVCYFDMVSPDGLTPAPNSRTERLFHVHLGACIYRKEVFEKIGTFDEDFVYGEDIDLMLRVREAGTPFTILRSTELYYRKHPSSMMAQNDERKQASVRMAARKSLMRRRALGLAHIALRDFSNYLEPVQ
jgi:glycosyltransferase involved in cell wall biosynthesis